MMKTKGAPWIGLLLLAPAVALAQTQGHWLNGGQTTGMSSPATNVLTLLTNGTAAVTINGTGAVGIGTGAPAALLDVYGLGSQSAILLPRDTTSNRPSGVNGMLRYNTTTAAVESYAGNAWSSLGGGGGGAGALSSLTAATATNSIDSLTYAQTWNWSTATTQTPFSLTAAALTTGSLLSVTSNSSSLNSTRGLLQVTNSSSSTNGVLASFQANSTAGSGLTVLTNGNVGVGTAVPASALDVAGGLKIANDSGSCTSAKTGTIRYVGGSPPYQFCNGSSWNPFESASGGGCTPSEAVTILGNAGYGLWGDGTYMYSADHTNLYAFSVNGATNTQLTAFALSNAEMVWGDGTYLYVTVSGSTTVYAFSFNGSTFTQLATTTVPNAATDVYSDGTYVYFSNGPTISAFTFNGSAFTAVGSYTLSGATIRHVRGNGGVGALYAAAGSSGLLILTFNGSSFTLNASDSGSGSSNQIAAAFDGTYYYLFDMYSGLTIYTRSGGTLTQAACSPSCTPGNPAGWDAVVSGGVLYAHGGSLKAYTLFTGSGMLTLKGVFTNYVNPWAVFVQNNQVFMSDYTMGTNAYNICNP